MILDTQFLGELVEQREAARAMAADLEDRKAVLRVPSMVVWEVYYGVENAPESKREVLQSGYEKLFRALPVVDLNDELARRAGELRGRHARSSSLRNLDGADSAVAATALSYDEPVVSNDRDFEDVDGLDVATYH